MSPLPEIEYKSLINADSPQLAPSICVANTLDQAFVEPLELQFVPGPSLFNDQNNHYYVRQVMAINKEFGIYPSSYNLNTFSPPVLTIEAVDKVACWWKDLQEMEGQKEGEKIYKRVGGQKMGEKGQIL